MLNDEQKENFSSLRVELIDLNVLAYFYIRKFNRFNYLLKNTTRHFMLEELIALRYMENGLILHLTNLDDDSSNYSFRKIIKEVNRTIKSQGEIKILKTKLDRFRKDINFIKVKYRNSRIAHLNYLTDLKIDEFLDFEKEIKFLIVNANEIGDLIWGVKIEYKIKLGSQEGIMNFRDLFEQTKFDRDCIKGFY